MSQKNCAKLFSPERREILGILVYCMLIKSFENLLQTTTQCYVSNNLEHLRLTR